MQFDILAAISVEAALTEMAAVRATMTASELGTMAGIGVLDQYHLAKAETSLRWWRSLGLVISSFYAFLAIALPAVSLAAGIAIDVAIFGGTAEDLRAHNAWFIGLSVGSLIFAVGIGIGRNYRKALLALSFAACLGASSIAADNLTFSKHFANLFPGLKSAENAADIKVSEAKAELKADEDRQASDENELQTGGDNGKPILTDVNPYNDDKGRALEFTDIPRDKTHVQEAKAKLSTAITQRDQVVLSSPAQYTGRVLAAVYIFAWLYASQLVIGKVIELGPEILRAQRLRSSQQSLRSSLIIQLESPESDVVRNLATALVSVLLMRFSKTLTLASASDENRQLNCGRLFEENSLKNMTEIGVELVLAGVGRRQKV